MNSLVCVHDNSALANRKRWEKLFNCHKSAGHPPGNNACKLFPLFRGFAIAMPAHSLQTIEHCHVNRNLIPLKREGYQIAGPIS
jgi:hypothetical protein